jgi:hypothetical protein
MHTCECEAEMIIPLKFGLKFTNQFKKKASSWFYKPVCGQYDEKVLDFTRKNDGANCVL